MREFDRALRAAASILSNVRERRQEAKNVREKLESDRERERENSA